MTKNRIHADSRNSVGVGSVTEKLGSGIEWEHKIKDAKKAHDIALRFVHRFELSEQEARRVNQRITHLKTLLAELR